MPLDPVARATGPLITGFSGTAIKIDGVARTGGVILTPLAAYDWDGIDWDGSEVTMALAIDPLPEFIIIGTGAAMIPPDRSLVMAYDARGIGIEAMDSRAAARVWSLLRAEGRWICAVLRPL
jgi:uncharacterized protein